MLIDHPPYSISMETKPDTIDNPWDTMETLTGEALQAAQEKLTKQGFTLHLCYGGTESGFGELIMMIAKLKSEQAEFKLIDNASEIQIWAKTSPAKEVSEKIRGETLSALGTDQRR